MAMRVLFFNRNRHWIGGDWIQLDNTARELRKLGVEVDTSDDPNVDISQYDAVHWAHLNFEWSQHMYQRVSEYNKPYFVSAIFYPENYGVSFDLMRDMVNASQKTIALSEIEKQEMIDILKCNPDKIVVIPNGVDTEMFHPGPEPMIDRIVSIGRLLPMKAPHYLLQAAAKLKLPVTYISSGDEIGYSDEVRPYIKDLRKNIPQEEVAQILRTSRIYVCPSLSERQSLSVLEAAACGLPIVDSIYNRGNGLLESSEVVDPMDNEALCQAILKQWNAPRNTDKVPTWKEVALQIKQIYDDQLLHN